MIRFVTKIICFLLAVTGIVSAIFLCRFFAALQLSSSAHTIRDGVEYVFLGSSQVGCAIEEFGAYRNQVIWKSSQSAHFWLMRLLELERLGQLEKIKAIVVECGSQDLGAYREEALLEGFLVAFPFSFRHIELMPFSWTTIVTFLSQRPNFSFATSEHPPQDGILMVDRSQTEIDSNVKRTVDVHYGWIQKEGRCYQDLFFENLEILVQMRDICKRHGVCLYVFHSPLTSYYKHAMPEEAKLYNVKLDEALRNMGFRVLIAPENVDDSYFRDANHMSAAGRRWFTEQLFKINKLLL